MARCVRALALWCAVVTCAAAYTIDCNHDYTDCESEIGKLAFDDGDPLLPLSSELVTEKTEPLDPITTTTSTSTTTTTTTTQTPVTSTTTEAVATTVGTNEVTDSNSKPKPRLLNLNVDELQNFANILHNQTDSKNAKKFFSDLSDIDLDAEDDEETTLEHEHQVEEKHNLPDKFFSNLEEPFHPMLNVDRTHESEICADNGVIYKVGDKINHGCEETCECTPGGHFECAPRCQSPFIRRGRRLNDPLCFESPVDECCSIIACATGNDAKPTSVEVCHYNNVTYTVGTKWNIGCEQTCTCEKESVVTCKPRCNRLPQSDKCINVQDPKDECCEVQVCDVSQDVHEESVDNSTNTVDVTKDREISMSKSTMRPLVLIEPIGSIKVLHNNSVQVNLMHTNNSDDPIHLQLSDNNGVTYRDVELKYSNLILNLEGGKDYILKTKETGTKFNFTITSTGENIEPMEDLRNKTKFGCYHDDKYYEVGDEFQIGCTEVCECTGQDTKECAPMVCPSHVGLEIVSKSCVQWAPNPPPVPPNCCPRTARCLSDGTCHYKGVAVPNWSKVPTELTGCEEHCFCENGELDCQEVCSPLPPLPPQNLRCPPMHRPAPMNVSDEDCCKEWGCVPHDMSKPIFPVNPHSQPPPFLPTVPPDNNHYPQEDIPDYDQNNVHRPIHPLDPALAGLPPGLHITSGDDNKRLSVLSLQGDSPTSVKMLFGLPSVLVGLKGSIDLRYTDTDDPDISQWYSQVFAPADEVLTTPRLEFRLTGLKPSTTYKIRGKLYLHSIPVEPESEILTVRTQDLPTIATVEEKRREIDCKLILLDVNDTTAHLGWRHFTEDELMLIDGIQVRYRSTGSPLYSMTELLHHSRSTAELTDLRPGSTYEASLVLMPPPRATTELFDSGKVEFTTAPYIDPYNWTVEVEAREVGAEAAELTWRGVPMPAEKWVRVYRAAHDCGDNRRDHDAFRLATRESQPSITLTGLEADTKCRVWLDLFLTNGKVKTSNVLEIHTKSLDSPENIDNVIESSSIARGPARGDYYGALVVVGVVAALAALAAVLLLLVVVRRHRPRSVQITSVPSAPRESSLPPYDNPAYKLEIQQETMDL